jgi:hypothetical protein
LRRCSINWGTRNRAVRKLTGDDDAVGPVAGKLRSRPALKLTGDDSAVRPVAIDERSPTGCGACRGSRRRLAEPVKPDETGWERFRLRESYAVEIAADEDTALMLALTVAIDAVALCAPEGPADLELGSVVRLLESGGRERR